MATYGVAEIREVEGAAVTERVGDVDLEELKDQLKEIRNAINPIIAEESQAGGFGLDSLEISLTVGASGKVLFIASGSVEASITMTFARPGVE